MKKLEEKETWTEEEIKQQEEEDKAKYQEALHVRGTKFNISLVARKPIFGVSDLVRHKPGCAAKENGLRLEISDLESRRIVLSV